MKVLLGMISEKKNEVKPLSFHIEQEMELEKFNCFFIGFLRYSFGRIKVTSTVIDKTVYTIHNLADLSCMPIDWFLYDRGFTERYFLTD